MVHILLGIPNSRSMELLSTAVQMSPATLKQRVGQSRTYIRPLQRNLDLAPVQEKFDDSEVNVAIAYNYNYVDVVNMWCKISTE